MKKQSLLILIIFLSCAAIAQTTPSFGIRAGVSSATVKGDAVNSLRGVLDFTDGLVATNNRRGIFAGGYAAIPLINKISLEPGLYYTQRGYLLAGDFALTGMKFLGANAKADFTTQYIDLPLFLKADIYGFQIFAGPQLSYLAKAQLRTTAQVLGFNVFNRKLDATGELNRWDVSLSGGLGYQFNNGFNVMASYDHGLLKADRNENLDAYNRSIKVGVGFSF